MTRAGSPTGADIGAATFVNVGVANGVGAAAVVAPGPIAPLVTPFVVGESGGAAVSLTLLSDSVVDSSLSCPVPTPCNVLISSLKSLGQIFALTSSGVHASNLKIISMTFSRESRCSHVLLSSAGSSGRGSKELGESSPLG